MSKDADRDTPPGWCWTRVGEVTERRVDQAGPQGDTTFAYVDISSIDNKGKRIAEPKILPVEQAPSLARQRLIAGDVLVSMTRPNLNAVAIVPEAMTGAIGTTGFHVLRAKGIDPRWLFYLVQTNDFIDAMSRIVQGVVYPAIRPKDIIDHFIPLAPLQEQRRIVAAIEANLTRLDSGVSNLERVREKLKRYRAAVLKAACEGRLVPTEAELVRAEGRTYEPADRLLARILQARRERWEVEQLAAFEAQGKRPTDDKWKDRYEAPAEPDTTGLRGLPEGWVWTSLGQAFRVYVGATPSRARPEYWGGSIPWVSSGEVSFCQITSTRETITESGLQNSSTELHSPGTVLLGMIGEGKTRGQVAILRIAACNNQNSAAIRVSESGLPPEYVYRFLEGEYEQTRRLGAGNSQPALNKTRVQAMILPLPPLAEQIRIVAEVERRLSLIDELDDAASANLKRADRLRQSILKRAFEGKLVPQDPDDEPAARLLERIGRRGKPATLFD